MEIDHKEFEQSIKVRPLRLEDLNDIVEMQLKCFPNMEPSTQEELEHQLEMFPEGQIVVELEGKVVATSSSLIVDYDLFSDWHDWKSISDNGHISSHNPHGDVLYGIEIAVHPECQGMKLARRLYNARKELVRDKNLKGIVIGGRIPNYKNFKDKMTVQEYVENVEDSTIFDPVLTTQLSNGFEMKQLLPDYLPSDEDSSGWATHMEWLNVDYRPFKKRAIQPVQIVRLAVVQYEMRPIKSFEEFERQCEYFVDTSSDFKSDFVLFPELFTTQLLSLLPQGKRPGEAARELAKFTPQYLDLFSDLAVRYHINIVAGSQFLLEDENLYNVSFLFQRDGRIGKQYKIHVTPAEWRWWGVNGGNKVEVFDTDCGRVAILICYDIEFPELARIAAKKGAQIIFCPYNTDQRHGYLRVMHCGLARCIENHVYVALSGCTGNLPQVANADIHYAQSGIYTPADIPFSRDAIAAECTPNVETLVMQDLDIELLRRHRYRGTTQNWRDRRKDLYEIHYKEDGEIKKV